MAGAKKYPELSDVALRVYSVPLSSASAERVWSIFENFHTKKRNRLSALKAEKLVFIHANSILLDEIDSLDYLEDYIDYEDDIETSQEQESVVLDEST